jgi:PAS domain S-box-containing protein
MPVMEAAAPELNHGHDRPAAYARFRELVETCPCALLAYEAQRIIYANPAAARLLGAASSDRLARQPLLELVHPDCRSTIEKVLEDTARDANGTACRALWVTLDAAIVELEARVTPFPADRARSGQIYLRPMQERRQLEDSLRDAEHRLRAVTDQAQNFAIFTVGVDARVASWNPGAERVFGYETAQIVGQPFEVLFVPEDRAKGAPAWELQQAAETGVAQDERWHLRADGSRVYISGLLVSVPDKAGKIVAFTKITQDRTEQRQAQEALEASESRYRQLVSDLEDRVACRTQHLQQSVQTWESFCYSIAHDLRAPLRTISGFAGALLEDYAPSMDATAQDYARRMVAAAERLDEFIHDLLSFGRLAHADLPQTAVPLEEIIDRVLAGLGDDAGLTRATVEVARPLPTVIANPAALHQVLSNLISNALKFVKPGSIPRVEVYARSHDNVVRLNIRDHGIGIEPEHVERVFQLFERLHPTSVYPGTGVGLAIVRKAMERMGGRVGVDSEPGKGTSFWIELPAAG